MPDQTAAETIAARAGRGFTAAIVLGSGLGGLTDRMEDAIRIPYADLPGFPRPGVGAHAAELVAGTLGCRRILAFAGRVHFYESGDPTAMAIPIDTAAALGAGVIILTNAAGSCHQAMAPGDVALIADHINFSGRNPLIGAAGDDRFVDMTDAYDPALRASVKAVAAEAAIPLHEGVYMWFSGPSFETPAEIRFARALGADLVGMSTVPEAILARRRKLRVLAFSAITNYAAGMSDVALSHEQTKRIAVQGAEKLSRLLPLVLERMA